MKRHTAIFGLLLLFCQIAFGSASIMHLCLHGDGFDHVVETKDRQGEFHGPCHAHNETTHQDVEHDQKSDSCIDLQVEGSSLDVVASNSDRSPVKSPVILWHASSERSYVIAGSNDLKIGAAPQAPPVLEAASRRFAKITQIRR